MTETQAIINAYRRARAGNVRAALATVVRVEGSAYRRPGVRMFITETGETTGVLSGGCLERDVCERAAKVMETGRPTLVTYDTTSDDDIVWGLGLGCNGIVQVLIEPASEDRADELMQLLEECADVQGRGAVATVIHDGDDGKLLARRAIVYPNQAAAPGPFISESGPGATIVDDLREALEDGRSSIRRYDTAASYLEIFFEVIEPQVSLVIVGAGDDALPLVTFARALGWHTTVVDTRARPSTIERLPEADAVLLCRPEDIADRIPWSRRTAVVLMTHNYLHDREILSALLDQPVGYLGLLGPRRRAEKLLSEIGDGAAAALLGRLHAPAGLDIGADTPGEIAMSIVGEIKAVLSGREGGLLRNRKGSIHSEAPVEKVETLWFVSSTSNSWPAERGQ
jgi:xanthine/CO dehydrogenase XdhC/CoxF family maturation factor